MKRFAITIALTFILVGSAFAQSKPGPVTPIDLWSGASFSEKMSGLETAKGTEDFEDNIVWGSSITLAGDSGEFTANINRQGITPDLERGHKIVGGTWTLHIYKDGELRGIIFGEFTDGLITWKANRQGFILTEYLTGSLVVTGGTGEFSSVGGGHTSGELTSVGDMSVRGFPLHKGSVSLNY